MEGQDNSLVGFTQWRDLLQLTSRFLADASELINAQLARQRILGNVKSEKKSDKPKTKRVKSGYQLFADEQYKELKNNPDAFGNYYEGMPLAEMSKMISRKWKELPDEEKTKWRDVVTHGNHEPEAPVHYQEPAPITPSKPKSSLLQEYEEASAEQQRKKHCKTYTAREPSSDSNAGDSDQDSSSEDERKSKKKHKHKHKHSSESKKHV